MNQFRPIVLTLIGLLYATLHSTAADANTLTFDNVGLVHGSLVFDQYASEGVLITADNFRRSFDLLVAFDSNASGTEDRDLEAASGGDTRWSGGNLLGQDLGLMLVLQENDDGCLYDGICDEPDDEGRRPAGTITFSFTEASVLDFGFDIVDVEKGEVDDGSVTLYSGDDSVTIGFEALLFGLEIGDNMANRIAPIVAGEQLGLLSFDKVVIELGGSGAIDNIVFTPVPEPSTAMLMALGLVGLGISGRRSQHRS